MFIPVFMETCKRCDASSWMVSLTDNGLCRRCNLFVVNRVQMAAEQIHRSLTLFRQVEESEILLRHAVHIVRHAGVLQEFEEMGIETVHPAPSRLAELFAEAREALESGAYAGTEASGELDFAPLPGPASIRLASAMDPLDSFSLREAGRPDAEEPEMTD